MIESSEFTNMRKYQIKDRVKHSLISIIRYLILFALAYVILSPVLLVVVSSFKSPLDLYDPTVQWIPKHLQTEGFRLALEELHLGFSLLNSLIYQIIPALLEFAVCSIVAYGLARFKFRGNKIVMAVVFLNILVPFSMIIIPNYVNLSHWDFLGLLGLINRLFNVDLRINLLDSIWAYYLPAIMGVGLQGGLYIYIYRQFYMSLPKELEEAAWIDGSGPWRTFINIIIPSSGPGLITVLILSVVTYWKDTTLYLYRSNAGTRSLSDAVSAFNVNNIPGQFTSSALASASLISFIPILIFYLFLQKKFVEGVNTSGLAN